MYLGMYEHEIRVVLIKLRLKQLSRDEAATQLKDVLTRLAKNAEEGKRRVDSILSHYLSDKLITVNEAESEILLGE